MESHWAYWVLSYSPGVCSSPGVCRPGSSWSFTWALWVVFGPSLGLPCSFPSPLASQPRNFCASVPGPGVADSITAANKYARPLKQPLTAGPRSQGQGQRARVEDPSFWVPGVSGSCLIAGPKLRVPCPVSLISGPRLQHPAFNLKSQGSVQSPKCWLQAPGLNSSPRCAD